MHIDIPIQSLHRHLTHRLHGRYVPIDLEAKYSVGALDFAAKGNEGFTACLDGKVLMDEVCLCFSLSLSVLMDGVFPSKLTVALSHSSSMLTPHRGAGMLRRSARRWAL